MTRLFVGQVLTTKGQIDALPIGAVVRDRDGVVATLRGYGQGRRWNPSIPSYYLPATILYLPDQAPRPEAVVAAEALRKAAARYPIMLLEDMVPRGDVASWLLDQANQIEEEMSTP